MTTFQELFGGMGPAYTAIVYAHLQVQAEQGNQDAARLIYGDLADPEADQLPQPGDVVIAKERTFVWDSADGQDWVWWSPAERDSVPGDALEDYELVIWHGRREMPPAAIELWDAVSWALESFHLCEQKENPRTHAKYFTPLEGIDSIGDLVEGFRAASAETPEPEPLEFD